MRIKIQLVVEDDDGIAPHVDEVACLQRGRLSPETLGITINEGKQILEKIQMNMTNCQVEEYINQHNFCPECKKHLAKKDTKQIVFRTVFGELHLNSPRFKECSCSQNKKRSFSPLSDCLPERTSPELLYLQTKWASLISYGMTVDLLEEVLPIKTSISSTIKNIDKVANRLESELGEEKFNYIDGAPNQWNELPIPDKRLTVGIDGGYIHGRDNENRKAGVFELIVGKSIPGDGDSKRFGFVNKYDKKPKRRLYETLKNQGLQMNQDITFLSDGGKSVRELQTYLSPQAEHILDWFHITMRITVLKQMAKGLKKNEDLQSLEETLDRVKWFIWNGNVYMALQVLDDLEDDIEIYKLENEPNIKLEKLHKTLCEFRGYISTNRNFIVNYRDRHFYGETISSAFVESTVNEVISKRMKKKQQMRWTKKGAHLLLQVRIQTLNNELLATFQRWYPEMKKAS